MLHIHLYKNNRYLILFTEAFFPKKRFLTLRMYFLLQKLLALLKCAAKQYGQGLSVQRAAIVNVSSLKSSIEDNRGGSSYPYRASKVNVAVFCK